MKHDLPKELDHLADILAIKATTADALAAEHMKLKETVDAEKQAKRAASGRHFAEVCRMAAQRIKVKIKMGAFMAPSFEEALAYTRVEFPSWPKDDVRSWWDHFETCGWVVGKGKPMRNWKSAAANGFKFWKEKYPGAPKASGGSADPEGWRAFLKSLARPYREFKYEQEFLRTQFRKQKSE